MASILRVNTLTDASSNNSTAMSTVFGGSAKAWHHGSSDGTSLEDSFNVGSLTDTATGKQTVNFSSNMTNVHYAVQNGPHQGQTRLSFCESLATSSYISSMYNANNSDYLDAHQNSTVHGDLA